MLLQGQESRPKRSLMLVLFLLSSFWSTHRMRISKSRCEERGGERGEGFGVMLCGIHAGHLGPGQHLGGWCGDEGPGLESERCASIRTVSLLSHSSAECPPSTTAAARLLLVQMSQEQAKVKDCKERCVGYFELLSLQGPSVRH